MSALPNRLEPGYSAPATRCFAITPNDATVLSPTPRFLYVGGAGDVAVLGLDDSSPVTFKAVPVGTVLAVRAKKVMSTNTTAASLVGMA